MDRKKLLQKYRTALQRVNSSILAHLSTSSSEAGEEEEENDCFALSSATPATTAVPAPSRSPVIEPLFPLSLEDVLCPLSATTADHSPASSSSFTAILVALNAGPSSGVSPFQLRRMVLRWLRSLLPPSSSSSATSTVLDEEQPPSGSSTIEVRVLCAPTSSYSLVIVTEKALIPPSHHPQDGAEGLRLPRCFAGLLSFPHGEEGKDDGRTVVEDDNSVVAEERVSSSSHNKRQRGGDNAVGHTTHHRGIRTTVLPSSSSCSSSSLTKRQSENVPVAVGDGERLPSSSSSSSSSSLFAAAFGLAVEGFSDDAGIKANDDEHGRSETAAAAAECIGMPRGSSGTAAPPLFLSFVQAQFSGPYQQQQKEEEGQAEELHRNNNNIDKDRSLFHDCLCRICHWTSIPNDEGDSENDGLVVGWTCDSRLLRHWSRQRRTTAPQQQQEEPQLATTAKKRTADGAIPAPTLWAVGGLATATHCLQHPGTVLPFPSSDVPHCRSGAIKMINLSFLAPGLFLCPSFLRQDEHDQILQELQVPTAATPVAVGAPTTLPTPSPSENSEPSSSSSSTKSDTKWEWEALHRRQVAHFNHRFYYHNLTLGNEAAEDLGRNRTLPSFYSWVRDRIQQGPLFSSSSSALHQHQEDAHVALNGTSRCRETPPSSSLSSRSAAEEQGPPSAGPPPPHPLQQPALLVQEQWPAALLSVPMNQLTVNQYNYHSPSSSSSSLPGAGGAGAIVSGIAHHVDSHSAFGEAIVAISLGSHTVMEFLPCCSSTSSSSSSSSSHTRKRRRSGFSLLLPPGSLLCMTDEVRYGWTHAILEHRADIVSDLLPPLVRRCRTSLTWRTARRTLPMTMVVGEGGGGVVEGVHTKECCLCPGLCDSKI